MTAPAWRVPPLQTGTAPALLADGIAEFEALAGDRTPILRWYRTTTPAIVLGRGQNRADVPGTGVQVVSRFSGGGAVWLSPDLLSLDVLLPADHPWVSDRLTAVFDRVGAVWLTALRDLGVHGLTVHAGASTARRRGTPREQLLAAVCYATRGRGEVLWHDRKLVGLAQRRRRHAAMVQCGLLRRWRPARLLAALGADPHDAEILHAAVGLDDLCPDAPDDDEVVTAVTETFAAAARGSVRS
jgi:lipoate-protein ligase A